MMIKASELRIGNYILDGDGNPVSILYFYPQEEDNNDFVLVWGIEVNGEYEFIEYCNPIPLTEEWMLKFGFEKDGEAVNRIIIDDYQLYPNSKVKYVHQLQNICFALTGRELEIK